MKYKGRSDIAARVIDAANKKGGATTTVIMYSAYLDYGGTKKYLGILTENELLKYDRQTERYRPTKKGLKFLELYNDVGVLFKKIAEA